MTESETIHQAARGRYRPLLWLLVLALLAGAVWTGRQTFAPDTVSLNTNSTAEDAIEQRLALLETQSAQLTRTLESIERKLAELASTPAAQHSAAAPGTDIEALRGELASISARTEEVAAAASEQVAGWIAWQQLQQQVMAGMQFEIALRALEHSANDAVRALLEPLRPFANTGRPADAALIRLAQEAVQNAYQQRDTKPGFWNAVGRQLRSIVQIRKVGDAQGTDRQAILARIEAAASDARLADIIQEVNAFQEEDKPIFSAFSEAQQRQQHIDAQMRLIEKALILPQTETDAN